MPAIARLPLRRAASPALLRDADLIDLVLAHADQREMEGGDRVRLSVTPATAARLGLSLADAGRLSRLAVTYDEAEDQLVRVTTLARPARPSLYAVADADPWWNEPLPLAA